VYTLAEIERRAAGQDPLPEPEATAAGTGHAAPATDPAA